MYLLLGPIRSISGYYIWAVREKLAIDTSESRINTNCTSTGPESHKENASDPHETKMTDTNELGDVKTVIAAQEAGVAVQEAGVAVAGAVVQGAGAGGGERRKWERWCKKRERRRKKREQW